MPPIPDRLAPPTAEKTPPSPQVASILPSATPSAESPTPPGQASAKDQAPVAGTAMPQGAAAPSPATPPTVVPAPSVTTAPGATPMPPAPSATALPAGTRIVIKASADAWVTIKQKAGPPLLNKLMHAGDSFAVPADKPDLTLTTGNAGGTEVDVDGTAVPGIGGSGMVRRDLPLDPAVLKAGNLPLLGHPHPKPPPAPDAASPER